MTNVPKTRFLAQIAGILVALAGCIVMTGWVLDIPALKSVLPGFVEMKFNTALCFVLSGIALWLLSRDNTERTTTRRVAYLFALLVALIGLLTLIQYLAGLNFGIDQLLWTEPPPAVNTSHLGRMAVATAFNFFFLGLAFLLLRKESWFKFVQACAFIGIFNCLVNFIGYLYGVETIYYNISYTPMALHTITAFVLLSVGIMLIYPERGVMAILSGKNPGSVMARNLLAVVFIVPPLLGWLRLRGQQSGLYDTEFGISLTVISTTVILFFIVIRYAGALNKSDAELQKSHDILEIKVQARTEELFHLNAVLRAIRNINQLIVREHDRDRLIKDACVKLIETRGYLSAWISLFDPSGKFLAAAEAGMDEQFKPLQAFLESGRLPACAGQALKKPGPQIITDPAKACADCPVSKKYPVKSSITIRLEYQDRIYGVMAVAIPPHIKTDAEELGLFIEVAGDIAFALHNIEMEEQQKQVERALEQSEKKYRNLVEHALTGVYQTTITGEVLYANDAFARMMEFDSVDEFVKQGATAKYKDPAERIRFIGILKKTGFIKNFETEFVTRTGQTRNVILSAKLEDNTIAGMVRDITEHKQAEKSLITSEARYRRLFEAARDGVIILDAGTGQIMDVNKFLINLLGFSHEQFLGKKIWEIGLFKDIVPNREKYKELQSKGYLRYENMPLETADGRMIAVEFVSNLYDVGSQKVIQCNIRDITERRKIESQLFQAQKLEGIGTLAGGVAHDFNNMIGAIKGYAELSLMDTDKSNPVYEYLKHIVASTDRAANLTRQLLIFSRGHSAELQPLNLNNNITDMLKMLTRLIGENIKIETKLAPDAATIKADAGNIEQVLMNLCVNARDAMPTGGAITIKTENVAVDDKYCQLNIESRCGDFVMLTVSDTGTGMSKEVLDHIFEPFYTTKTQGKGTGLGLSVVYGIVKKHQGWINVYSEPSPAGEPRPNGGGQGSVFKIYLPVSTEKPRPKSDTKIILPEQLKGKSERILVIEDDDGIRNLVTNALGKMNYQVFTASNGAQARQLFAREKGVFHFILSDVVLPDTNGVDLSDELIKSKPAATGASLACGRGIPILLSSGYASKGAYGDVIRARGLPFIQKPYNLSVLFKTIRAMLEK